MPEFPSSVSVTKLHHAFITATDPVAAKVAAEEITRCVLIKIQPLLLAYARQYGLSAQSADDVVQETYKRFLEWTMVAKDRRHLRNWLILVVRNVALDRQRSRKTLQLLEDELSNNKEHGDIAAALADRELIETLSQALSTLAADEREIVVARFFHDMTLQEIANSIGCSVTTIFNRLDRALSKLYRSLEDAAG